MLKHVHINVTNVTKKMLMGLATIVVAFTPLAVTTNAHAANPEFTASEIFDAAAMPVMGTPLSSTPLVDTTDMIQAGLPSEALVNVVAIGLVQSVDTAQGRYQVEGKQFYASSTSKMDAGVTVGTYVRVVALRSLFSGALVIDSLTIRTVPAAGPKSILNYDYVTPGVVQTIGSHIWTISGIDYVVDNVNVPAVITPNLTLGTPVGVQFMTNAAANASTAPASATTFTGVEIFPIAALGVPGTALHTNPKLDIAPMGVNDLPANTYVSVVISGFIQAINAEKNEIKIADRYVYTSAATKIKGNTAPGSYVKIVTSRKVEDSPLVADVITQRTAPKGATAARVDAFYITHGIVDVVSPTVWKVAGVDYILNDPLFPASISASGVVGEEVGIQFLSGQTPYRILPSTTSTGPSLPPVTPPAVTTATFNAAEIFPDAGVPSVPAPKFPFATVDTTNYSAPNLPADTIVSLAIDGSIDGIDLAKGEYKIGGKKVYISNQTVLKGIITTNSQVRIVALRTVANGPLVAEKIVAKNIIGKVKTPATTVFYVTRGQVQAITQNSWTISNYSYLINNPVLPAAISVPSTTGQFVGVQFTL